MTGHEPPPAVLSEELIAAATPVTASSRTDDIPVSWDERTVLTTMLAYVRDTVHVKCAGLSDEQARMAPLPGSPLTAISSLISHLRWVEYYWIRVVLLGEPDQTPVTEEDPDAEADRCGRDGRGLPGQGRAPGAAGRAEGHGVGHGRRRDVAPAFHPGVAGRDQRHQRRRLPMARPLTSG
jgi:hypothetical protein